LATSLTALWALEDKYNIPTVRALKPRKVHGKTLARFQDDSLMDVLANARLGGEGITCLDWGTKPNYGTQFTNCRTVYEFEFSATRQVFDPVKKKIVGDIKDLSFVPAGTFDLIFCTAVFEHVPQFWRAAKMLPHLIKAGGILIFDVPFFYPTHFCPGDFWRFTFQGASYLLESNQFRVCRAFGGGERAAQMLALGLNQGDVPMSFLANGTRGGANAALFSTGYVLIAVKKGGPASCATLPILIGNHYSNSFTKAEFINTHKLKTPFWPTDAGEGWTSLPSQKGRWG